MKLKIFILVCLSTILGVALIGFNLTTLIVALVCFIPLVIFMCTRFDYIRLLKLMIFVFFFIPIHYVRVLNLFHFLNPLILLGCVLLIKGFIEKFSWEAGPFSCGLTVIDKTFFFFIILASVSSFFALSKLGAFNWVFTSILIGFVPLKVIEYLNRDKLVELIEFLVVCGAICAIEGILEFVFKYSILFPVNSGRLTSLLGHPLVNGLVFSVLFPLSMFLYCSLRKRRFLFLGAILLVSVLLTLSRGSWLALGVGLLIIWFISPLKFKFRFAGGIVFVILILSVIPYTRQIILNRLSTSEDEQFSSWNIRFKSIPIAVDVLKDKPFFGGGPFNSGRHKEDYAVNSVLRRTSFENSYLGILVDLGYPAFFLLIFALSLVFKRLLSFSKNMVELGYQPLYFLWSYLVMVVNLGTFNFDSYRSFSFFFWFVIAIAFVYGAPKGEIFCSSAKTPLLIK